MNRLPLALAVTLLPLGGAAGGAVPGPTAVQTVEGSRAVQAMLDGDRRAAMIEGLVDAGADRASVEALADGAVGEQLLVAPDLDDDGLPDAVGLARHPRPGQSLAAAAESILATGRSGRTGVPVWTVEVPGETGTIMDDGVGLLLVTTEETAAAGLTLHLTALDRDGPIRWRWSETGLLPGSAVTQRWPVFRGSLRREDGTSASLVQLLNYTFLVGEVAEPYRLETIVIGSDGQEIGHTTDTGQGVGWTHPVGDLDGDENDDFLFTVASIAGSRGQVVARTQAGVDLWSSEAPFYSNGWVEASDDATGDGVPDAAIGGGVGNVALLSGDDGSPAWELSGSWPSAIGDVDGDGLADVGIRNLGINTGNHTIVSRHRAYTGEGDELYDTTTSIGFPQGGFSSTTLTRLITGDFDGDGLADTTHETNVSGSDGTWTAFDGGATSGADGTRLWTGPLRQELGAPIAGPGEDLAWIRPLGSSEVLVDAISGADGRQLWRVNLYVPGVTVSSVAKAADLDGDGTGEMLVTVVTEEGASVVQHGFVLDGHDGSILWAARAQITDPLGDANGLQEIVGERDGRPASHDPADILEVRLETEYVATPVGEDGIDYEPTALVVRFHTAEPPRTDAPTLDYRMLLELPGCSGWLAAAIRGPAPVPETPADRQLRWLQYSTSCPDGESVVTHPGWSATIDAQGWVWRIPFGTLTPAQGGTLAPGRTVDAPRAVTEADRAGGLTNAVGSIVVGRLDATDPGADFVIGSDVPPDVPCTKGCP